MDSFFVLTLRDVIGLGFWGVVIGLFLLYLLLVFIIESFMKASEAFSKRSKRTDLIVKVGLYLYIGGCVSYAYIVTLKHFNVAITTLPFVDIIVLLFVPAIALTFTIGFLLNFAYGKRW